MHSVGWLQGLVWWPHHPLFTDVTRDILCPHSLSPALLSGTHLAPSCSWGVFPGSDAEPYGAVVCVGRETTSVCGPLPLRAHQSIEHGTWSTPSLLVIRSASHLYSRFRWTHWALRSWKANSTQLNHRGSAWRCTRQVVLALPSLCSHSEEWSALLTGRPRVIPCDHFITGGWAGPPAPGHTSVWCAFPGGKPLTLSVHPMWSVHIEQVQGTQVWFSYNFKLKSKIRSKASSGSEAGGGSEPSQFAFSDCG